MAVTQASTDRLGTTLEQVLEAMDVPGAPPKLAAAMRYAVLPGGARIRPRLCLAIAEACGGSDAELALAVAASLELMHCASLVHDDMPAFDDADVRRGKPSVHKAFGESLALLTGDALIILAFDTLAGGASKALDRLPRMVRRLSASIGMPTGLCAGQAWEEEPHPDLGAYHEAKTGALFAGVAALGADAGGYADPDEWAEFGVRLGKAYQIADDIRDIVSNAEQIGKPCGQDGRLGRPNIALQQGVGRAVRLLLGEVDNAIDIIPPCVGRSELVHLVRATTQKFLPESIWALAS